MKILGKVTNLKERILLRIGTSELVVIFIVALLVLGPDKVPKYAKKAGKMLSSIKVYADKLSEDINESIVEPLEEVQKPLKKAVEPLKDISNDISKPIKDIKKSVNDIGKPQKKEEAVLTALGETQQATVEELSIETEKETENVTTEEVVQEN